MFEKYADVNNLEALSLGDITKWDYIKTIERGAVYTKLALNRDKNIFQKAYNKLLADESKRANRTSG